MSPFERIGRIEDDLRRFRHRIYILITVGFVLIGAGLGITFWSYFSNQDQTRETACQNSQTLVTQYEWFKYLAIQNATNLPASDVRQRVDFYDKTERLIPTQACHMDLSQLRQEAEKQIKTITDQ